MIPHDLLEHQNGAHNIGQMWDELQAMGALWWVRGRHGSLGDVSFYHPDQRIANDVNTFYESSETPIWPPTRPKLRPIPEDEDIDMIMEMVDVSDEEYCEAARYNMRLGLRKAKRRANDLDTYKAIERALKPYCHALYYEGQEFILGYGAGRALVREVHHAYY